MHRTISTLLDWETCGLTPVFHFRINYSTIVYIVHCNTYFSLWYGGSWTVFPFYFMEQDEDGRRDINDNQDLSKKGHEAWLVTEAEKSRIYATTLGLPASGTRGELVPRHA